MKTPMQELIEELKEELNSNIISNDEIAIMKWVIRIVEEKLEKEKAIINQAYEQGSIDKKSGRFVIDYYKSLTPKEN